MDSERTSFGHLTLSRRANGENVRLVRSPDEAVLLGFDTQTKRLVELHLLHNGQPMEGAMKKSSMERAALAAEIRGPTFMRILEVGEDQGVVYYTSNLNEGEFLTDYVERRGALPPATVFSLLLQLLDDVMLLAAQPRLSCNLRLDRVMITTVEDTFLQLRLYDFGLGKTERVVNDHSRQVLQVCELIFLLLTGKAFAGDNPDRYPALTALPMSLRTTVRAALVDPGNTPTSLEKMRDDVREAYSAQVSSIQARNTRKHLVVTPALQPYSQLQDLLLEGVPVERVLGSRFRVEDEDHARRYPFSIPCINAKSDQPITVHLLPPSRVVDRALYEAVPLQSWRFSPEKHPNILRSLSLWESPDWSFLTEERDPGFSLSRLLTERLTLNPTEVAIVLKQVQAGIEQALDCGVTTLEMHPSNLFMKVGKPGPMLAREHERLMQKRLDAWPPFQVKLRPHMTMRNLYEPPLSEPPDITQRESEHLAAQEHRQRSFISLATFLLTGQRQVGDAPAFPESVPDALAVYLRETLENIRLRGISPSTADFVNRFETAMSAGPATTDLATRLRGSNVSLEEMESVGSVSDFDEESLEVEYDDPSVSPISRRLHAHEFDQAKTKSSLFFWPALAAAAVVIFGLGTWWFMAGSQKNPVITATATGTAENPKSETKDQELPQAKIAQTAPPAPKPQVADIPEPPAPPPAKPTQPAEPAKPSPAVVADVPAPPQPMPPKSPPSSPEAVAKSAPTAQADVPLPPLAPGPVKVANDPSKPPTPVIVPNPVIIRKAIMPTPEEIAKFKQGQAKPKPSPQPVQATPPAPPQPGQPPQIGVMPVTNMAAPLDAAKKS